jgi:hypothetical protein
MSDRNRFVTDPIAQAIRDVLQTPDEVAPGGRQANAADGLFQLGRSVEAAADRLASVGADLHALGTRYLDLLGDLVDTLRDRV